MRGKLAFSVADLLYLLLPIQNVRSPREREGRQCSGPPSLQVLNPVRNEFVESGIFIFSLVRKYNSAKWNCFVFVSLSFDVLLRFIIFTGRLARKSCGAMRRRLLLAMITVEKWLCPKALQGSISTGFSLLIRYSA